MVIYLSANHFTKVFFVFQNKRDCVISLICSDGYRNFTAHSKQCLYSPLQLHKAALCPLWMYHEVQDLGPCHLLYQI